jgi:hypothetical protein
MSEHIQQRAEIERCRREIADIEAQIRAGHPDVEGLCLALSDWRGSCGGCKQAEGWPPLRHG